MLPHLTHGTKQKNKTSNIIDSVSLGFAGMGGSPISPLNAPDVDYLHWIDFSDDPARVTRSGGAFLYALCPKTGLLGIGNSYTSGAGPLDGVVINSLQAADYTDAFDRLLTIKSVTDPNLRFKYPSMTMFFIVQPKVQVNQGGMLISDYGSVVNKQMFVRVSNGTTLQVIASIRDSAGNTIAVNSGGTLLSLNTDYLIVAKLDGANRQVDLWIDGANNAYTGSNGAYDNTTTWEGAYDTDAYATLGALSQFFNNGFKGFLGSMFITKTALSNADINKYAKWMAAKWGTTWVDV